MNFTTMLANVITTLALMQLIDWLTFLLTKKELTATSSLFIAVSILWILPLTGVGSLWI